MVDHDRLFKELLSTFFLEFLALFAPALRREVDSDSVEFLEKELAARITAQPQDALDQLTKDLLDLSTLHDVQQWLAKGGL